MRQPRRRVTNITKTVTPAVVPPITAPVLMEDMASEDMASEEMVPEGVGASVIVRISSRKSPRVSGGHFFHNIHYASRWSVAICFFSY